MIVAFFLSRPVSATEQGGSNYLPGFYGDFEMGAMPEKPGFYLNNLFSAYQDPKAVTGNLLEMPGIMYVTELKFLGGNFTTGLWPALQLVKDNSVDDNHAILAIGDPYLMPVLLSWDWSDIKAQVFEGISAPMGYYAKNQLSAGSNIWTFDHNLAVTFKLPADNELSMDLGYMNNTQNPATHYTNGDELHIDYLLGHYFQDNFGLGVVGSYYRQLTADQAPPTTMAKVFTAADTIGPAVMFTPPIGRQEINMSLKWLHEFNVQGRLPQDYILWRIDSPF